ncbi:MAG TPA: 4-hydroxy-3-methylbut-2-enyl diphosphate reductase [Candidatus Aphodousia gallistercoris]|nr:4-hydroxy-3-methylbut-2-enyl diphosphate reductase [Candidatus Aphodousia gallistercoris]
MQVYLAQPRGFCAGVNRAIAIVEKALAVYGRPIYVRHEIVHNKTVVNELKAKGAIFVEHLSEVPDGATAILSAHGVPQSVKDYAATRNLRIFDATCPLVMKVHREVIKMHREGLSVVVIGHKGHAEVQGTMGQVPGNIFRVYSNEEVDALQVPDPQKVGYVTQTTLSADETKEVIARLKSRFPMIKSLSAADICYATQSRQEAVKKLAARVQLVLVIGSSTSSNSRRLRDIAQKAGVKAFLIDSAEDIEPSWFDDIERLGLTAGASAPEHLVQGVVEFLKKRSAVSVITMEGTADRIAFPLPAGL